MQDNISNAKTYVGIDPGSDGCVCAMPPGEEPVLFPLKDTTPYKVADFLRAVKGRGSVVAAVEEVHAMHGQGVTSTFAFGFNTGWLHGVLIALAIPYITVRPQEWQAEIWITRDKVRKTSTQTLKDGTKRQVGKTDPKPTSINAATRLFPTVSLMRTPRSVKPHDGMADSLLICEYARRKNL